MILVSNRLPITIKRAGKKTVITRSSGGLVAGLAPIHDRGDSLWIGNVGGNVESFTDQLREQRLIPVPLAADVAKGHYEGYSNGVLWPLFHYLLGHVTFEGAAFAAYRKVNEAFATVVAEHAKPNDMIWIHDYHLMLLPTLLRELLPNAAIGFFLHIPFPSSEVLRILPRKEEILTGLLGADLIGVHTYDYGRHLVSSFRRILGVEFDDDWVRARDGRSKVGVFPLGVDVDTLSRQAVDISVERRLRRLRKRTEGRKVILGVDRMDYTKGLLLRLRAYRHLLESEPRWRKDALYIQLAVPSRSNIQSYKDLKQEVERAIGEINGAFGQEGIVPVEYMYRSVPMEELSALYRLADVAWVTPIRDGMNLVAKEYVAHRIDDTGVLVLSEFAGAASEMGEALLHNPWDTDGTARTLDRALCMEEGAIRQQMAALRKRIRTYDVHRWVQRFVEALELQAQVPGFDEQSATQESAAKGWPQALGREFGSARRKLIALDYDGTLVDLQATPDLAVPPAELLSLLGELGHIPDVDLVVISGRDPDTLEQWLGDCPLHLVAEHGLHWRLRGENDWETLLHLGDMTWKSAVREILEEYAARTRGAFVEEKPASLAWHYRQVNISFGLWQARELAQHISEAFANSALEVLHGSKVVEVRPQGFDKGRALALLIAKLGPYDLVIAAGDDRTDEDMFAQLGPEGWTIKIGRGMTHARYRLDAPADLAALLHRFLDE